MAAACSAVHAQLVEEVLLQVPARLHLASLPLLVLPLLLALLADALPHMSVLRSYPRFRYHSAELIQTVLLIPPLGSVS